MRIVLCSVLAFILVSCATMRTVVEDTGPVVVQLVARDGVKMALADNRVPKSNAMLIGRYLVDAREFINKGQTPANALDDLSAFLNEKIGNDAILSALQVAIGIIKRNVVIPVNGYLSEDVKRWVIALLDGSFDGVNDYVRSFEAPPSSPMVIDSGRVNFR